MLCSAFAFNSYGCKKAKKAVAEAPVVEAEADSVASGYDYILVERVGGGDKLFSIAPNGSDSIDAEFARYGFRDTTFALHLSNAELGDSLQNVLGNILSGKQEIERKDTLRTARGFMMGSWMNCHAVKDTVKTAITDEAAKSAISGIEQYINSKIAIEK